MKFLMDTHVFLWLIFEPRKLSRLAKKKLEAPTEPHCISIATLWEIVVKTQIGKLQLGCRVETFFAEYVSNRDLTVLDIELGDLLAYATLPMLHRDPFDRLLVAQATARDLTIISSDESIQSYRAKTLW
jgi:PIN domain nuclease of toxin-antitoxin system